MRCVICKSSEIRMKRIEEEVPHLLDKRGDVAPALPEVTLWPQFRNKDDGITRREKRQRGEDIVLIPMEVLVCQNCGERYYDRKTMLKLEEMRDRLTRRDVELEGVGKVLRAKMA